MIILTLSILNHPIGIITPLAFMIPLKIKILFKISFKMALFHSNTLNMFRITGLAGKLLLGLMCPQLLTPDEHSH